VTGWLKGNIRVIDLVGIRGVDGRLQNYEGIAW
jgi:hypothetical protein